jgi:hypothetical protein
MKVVPQTIVCPFYRGQAYFILRDATFDILRGADESKHRLLQILSGRLREKRLERTRREWKLKKQWKNAM